MGRCDNMRHLMGVPRIVGVAIALMMPAQSAHAGEPPEETETWLQIGIDGGDSSTNPSATITAVELRETGGSTPAPANTRPRRCEVRQAPTGALSVERAVRDQLRTVDAMVAGTTYYLECAYVDDGVIFYADLFEYQPGVPGSGPDLAAIARQVYDEVPLVFPDPHTAPPVDADQLVGLPTWLWIGPAAFQTFRADASLAGITVTVTAEPVDVTWGMGDGGTETCDGPGTPWDPAGGDDQSTDCSHLYRYVSSEQPGGRYSASVTVRWAVSWTSSTGAGGSLPDATRTTTFDLRVTERQAVVRYGD
jgi:hypothetical protein